MNEEIEEVPKKNKKSRNKNTESEQAESDIEVVEPIAIESVKSLISNEETGNLQKIDDVKEMGLIVSDDKMMHRKVMMQCNSCFIADSCPQFKIDSDCTIEWSRLFKGEFTPSDLLQSSVAVLDLQLMRINRAATFEALNQGILDPELSREIGRYFEMMKMFKEMAESPQPTISITAKGAATQSGGVLSKLLGLK